MIPLNKGTAFAVRACCLRLLLLVATIISLTASARSAINANAAWDFTSNDLYDFEDRLVTAVRTAGTITMVYDGDGNRIRKTVSGTTTHYLVDDQNPTGYAQVLEESTTLNGQPNVMYVYGLDLINQHRKVGAAWETDYYGYDGHGSVRFLTTESGAISERYTYDAFGNHLGSPGATPNKYLYAGEQWDSHLGMYYLRARYYHPGLGRFWTKDTYEGNKTDPLSLHQYLYCAADPVNNVDPSGHDPSFTAAGQTAISGIQFNSRTLEGVAVAEFQRRAVQTLIFKVGAYAISGTAITTGIIAPAAIVISEAQRSAAMTRLKADIEREKQRRGGEILFHYTDWESAVQIAMTGVIYASDRYVSGNYTFPSGAYATDVPPWSMEYTQSQLSALFYGGVEHHPVGAFVAIERNDFAGPLAYKGFPNQYYRPAAPGQPVPVRVVTHGPNLMR